MQRIIDAHCHIYPDAIARKAVSAVDKFYDGLPEDHCDGTIALLLAVGSAAGIRHYIVHSVRRSRSRSIPSTPSSPAARRLRAAHLRGWARCIRTAPTSGATLKRSGRWGFAA